MNCNFDKKIQYGLQIGFAHMHKNITSNCASIYMDNKTINSM